MVIYCGNTEEKTVTDQERSDAAKCHTAVKGEHPEALVLVMDKDTVRSFDLDALTIAEKLGLQRDDEGMVSFPRADMETNLHVLASHGFRIAVAEVSEEGEPSNGNGQGSR